MRSDSSMAPMETPPDKSRWSGFVRGMRLGLPVAPGIMAFGVVVGAAAARQGLTFVQSLAMNFLVCSGIAQLVALEIWPAVVTWGAVLIGRRARGRGRGAPFPDECLHASMARATAGLASLLGAVFSHGCDLVDCHALSCRGRQRCCRVFRSSQRNHGRLASRHGCRLFRRQLHY